MGFLVPVVAVLTVAGFFSADPRANMPLALGVLAAGSLIAGYLGRESGRWALMTMVLAAAVLAAGVLGVRTGALNLGDALRFGLGGGTVIGIVAAVAGLWALFAGQDKLSALAAAALSVALIALPVQATLQGRGVPPIHDISTDTADPPAFVAIAPLRKKDNADNPSEYAGAEAAAAQAKAYPDIQPLILAVPQAEAFAKALKAANAMPGWQIVESAEAEGRIEATATTVIMGFKDDVVVRVRADAGGARIDVRSKSRVGVSDMGANAARIRAYLAKVKEL
jgi:uncharacterized protein (DUF1499 family)